MKKYLLACFYLLVLGAQLNAQSENAPEPTLETPYNTMYVHLYYLQAETYYPELSAVTLSRTKDSLSLIEDAIKLKQIFDGNGLFVRLNQLPQEKNYIDSTTQKSFYTPFPKALPDVYLEKQNDQWLFSSETIKLIPKLHKETYPFGTDRLLTLLPKLGQNRFLGLAVWQYLSFLIIFVLGWLLFQLMTQILRPLVRRLISVYLKSEYIESDKILSIARAISLLLLFWLIRILIPVLQLPISATEWLILIVRIIMTVFAVILAVRVIRVAMQYALHFAKGTEQRMDEQLIPIIDRTLKVIFVLIGVFHILQLLDVNIAALIAGVSIGGLALALAAQDTVKNLIGSAMIFFDRPFQIGDYIQGGGVEGTVTEVGFRTTRLKTTDTSIIAVPNGTIANAAITNKGVRVYRLFTTNLGVTYSTSPDLIEKFIEGLRQMILSHPMTKKEDYFVHLTALDASSLSILFRTYLEVDNWSDETKAKESLMFGILRLAEALKVDFAFPSSTIYTGADSSSSELLLENTDESIKDFIKDFKHRNQKSDEFLD